MPTQPLVITPIKPGHYTSPAAFEMPITFPSRKQSHREIDSCWRAITPGTMCLCLIETAWFFFLLFLIFCKHWTLQYHSFHYQCKPDLWHKMLMDKNTNKLRGWTWNWIHSISHWKAKKLLQMSFYYLQEMEDQNENSIYILITTTSLEAATSFTN